jgi:hypothetical protein
MSKAGNVAWNRRGARGKVNLDGFAIHSFDCDSFFVRTHLRRRCKLPVRECHADSPRIDELRFAATRRCPFPAPLITMVACAGSPAFPIQESCGPPQIPRRRASGARAAERINCPSWTVAHPGRSGRDGKVRVLLGGACGADGLETGGVLVPPRLGAQEGEHWTGWLVGAAQTERPGAGAESALGQAGRGGTPFLDRSANGWSAGGIHGGRCPIARARQPTLHTEAGV